MKQFVPLIMTIGLLSCKQADKSPLSSNADTTQTKPTNDFYSISKTYGDYESDLLLLPTDIKQKINSIRTKGNEIKEQRYGGGDCWGKVRRFVLGNDTLTIDKHNCGEHGFENRVFLKKGDSLKVVAIYGVIPLQSEKETMYTDILEIAEFKKEESTLKTSSESIDDWDNIKLDRPPGKSIHFQGKNSINDYLFYLDQYKKLRALELVSE